DAPVLERRAARDRRPVHGDEGDHQRDLPDRRGQRAAGARARPQDPDRLAHGRRGRGQADRGTLTVRYALLVYGEPGEALLERLAPADTATTVRVRELETVVSDGPSTEAAEALRGVAL